MLRKTNLANKKNYGGKRVKSVEWIVIHYTAVDGDSDENNAKFFQNNVVSASAHYFVDDDSCTMSVPEDYVAWSVGGKKYANNGGKYYGKCTNNNSISIELCDAKKDKKIAPTEKTISNAIELTKELMNKYNVKVDHVIRHYDVNGKPCPAYWVDDDKWEKEFHSKLSTKNSNNKKDKTEQKTIYYPMCSKSYTSLVLALNSLGIDSSKQFRTKIANANGIANYVYSAEQNGTLLSLLKNGNLIKP